MISDPLLLPATPARLRVAADAAALSPRALDRALEIATATRAPAAWHRFLSRTLALLGAALILAGVVCFFAFNWERIGRFGKLGLIAGGIVAATLIAWRKLPQLSGQIALTAAAVLVGPLLGVYGQTYQTGADPYGLFLTWALLVLPWAIAARFAALWVVEVILADLALTLWWSQVVTPRWADHWVGSFVIVGAVHAVAAIAWEWQLRRRKPWLTEKWAPNEVAAAGFASLFFGAATFVFEPRYTEVAGLIALIGLAAAIAASFWYFQRVRRDRFMITVAGATGLLLVTVVVSRFIMKDLDLDELGLLLIAVFVISEITLGLRWLRAQRPPQHDHGA